jgi:hypothetical protein
MPLALFFKRCAIIALMLNWRPLVLNRARQQAAIWPLPHGRGSDQTPLLLKNPDNKRRPSWARSQEAS